MCPKASQGFKARAHLPCNTARKENTYKMYQTVANKQLSKPAAANTLFVNGDD